MRVPVLPSAFLFAALLGCGGGTPPSSTGRAAVAPTAPPDALMDSCDHGVLKSCAALGERYLKGENVARDPRRGVALLERACDGGDVGGCLMLGVALQNGLGVARDSKRAAALFDRACQAGFVPGCDNLGILYDLGLGVVRDPVRAVALFHGVLDIVMTSPANGPLTPIMGAILTIFGLAIPAVLGATNLALVPRVQPPSSDRC